MSERGLVWDGEDDDQLYGVIYKAQTLNYLIFCRISM